MKKYRFFDRLFAYTASCILAFLLIGFSAATAQVEPDIEDVLENLNDEFSTINSIIPNRFNFTDGETGYYIYDGGGDMYDGGNYLATNLGGYINYSNNTINSTSYFGGEGKYFTRKFTGLFVLTANLNDVNEFNIDGSIWNYSGSVDGSVLTSGLYKGFVKRVYNSSYGNPSVNHLIIVKNNASVQHTYSSSTYSDNHSITNLNNTTRIYYLLYAGTDGFYIDDDATQQIMDAFVALLVTDTIPSNPVSNLFASNILNSSALLSWTAPHDDSLTEPVTAYDVRLSTSPINSQNYFSMPVYQQSVTPGVPGTTDSLELTGLSGETQYWAGIRAIDEGENYSSPVITVFTTGADPAIAVSVNSLEFEASIGETVTGSFNISNSAAGSSPLSYSITSDNLPVNDVMTYIANSNATISMVNLVTKEIEDVFIGTPISDIDYSTAHDDIWVTSTDYDQIIILSAINKLIRAQTSLNNLFKVCIPKNQDKVYALYSTYPLKVTVYDANSLDTEGTYSIADIQPDYAEISPDGSKLYLSDYYYLYVIDATNGTLLNTINLNELYAEYFVISDDSQFAYSYYYNYISKINLQTGAITTKALNSEIYSMALSPDGQNLFMGYYYSPIITIINTETMLQSAQLTKSNNYTTDLHVSANGKKLYCLSYNSPSITVFDIPKLKIAETIVSGYDTRKFTFPGGYDDYLHINPESGLLSSNQNQDIGISISTDMMIPGIYHSDIKIQSNDPSNALVTIPVTLYARDVTGPDFNIVFFQNHYLTSNLKVMAFTHEDMLETPTLKAGSTDLGLEMLDSLFYIFDASYKLTTTGDITFTLSGQDSVGNTTTIERVLSSTQLFKDAEITAKYLVDEASVEFQPETSASDIFVTIWKEWLDNENSWVYHIGPEELMLNQTAVLSISYDEATSPNINPSHLSIFKKESNTDTWVNIPSKINRKDRLVKAEVGSLGVYKFGYDDNILSPDEKPETGLSDHFVTAPNPFSKETTLFYENPEDGEVLISIYDNTGNVIATPVSEFQEKGPQHLILKGSDMKNGIYTCRIKTSKGEMIQKIVRID